MCARVCGRRVPAPLKVSGQGPFSMQQGIISKGGSLNKNIQGHKPDTNDKGGGDGNQTWSVTLTDEGMWECENVYSSEAG